MSDIRYCWALSDSDRFQGDCAAREEAVEEARLCLSDIGEGPGREATVWTGEADEIRPRDLLRGADVEWLLENLDEALSEETGAEWPVYLPERLDRAAMVAALEASIGEVLDRWTDEWGIPRQYRVEKVREHTVTLDPVEGAMSERREVRGWVPVDFASREATAVLPYRLAVDDVPVVIRHADDDAALLERANLWDCPDCGFSYHASHVVAQTGEHECPVCENAVLAAEVLRLRKEAESSRLTEVPAPS